MSSKVTSDCDGISGLTSTNYPKIDCLPSPRRDVSRDDTSPARASTCSGMSASSEDTSDSGFFQLNPDMGGLSPRPSRAERRLSGATDGEDIDFFLKVVGEFREYVAEKLESLESQNRENQNYLDDLQQLLKQCENSWSEHEVKVAQDINHLVALLHKQLAVFLENIKKHRSKGTEDLREKMDVCRRNMKIISGVIAFARRVQNDKDDTIRENTLRELKQRFSLANERTLPPIESFAITRETMGLEKLQEMKEYLEELVLGETKHATAVKAHELRVPSIIAPKSSTDITKNSIFIQWTDNPDASSDNDATYELFWEFQENGKAVKRNQKAIADTSYVIEDLRPCCDVTVRVQRQTPTHSSDVSEPAYFKTLPEPAKFRFDADTANSKLQLSSDLYSVYFPGEDKTAFPKSPTRFTFALNVLGSISFFSGRHYWEVLVNRDGWAVGVAYRSVPRNSWLGSNDSSWILHYNPAKREYKMRHAGESEDVRQTSKRLGDEISRVGIFIDYEAGIISFLDCHHKDVLYTYRTGGFQEPVCAAVNPFYHGGVLTVITGLDIPSVNLLDS